MRNESNSLRDLAAVTGARPFAFQPCKSPTKEQLDAVFGMSGASTASTSSTSSSSHSGRPSLQDLIAAIPSGPYASKGASSTRPPGLYFCCGVPHLWNYARYSPYRDSGLLECQQIRDESNHEQRNLYAKNEGPFCVMQTWLVYIYICVQKLRLLFCFYDYRFRPFIDWSYFICGSRFVSRVSPRG